MFNVNISLEGAPSWLLVVLVVGALLVEVIGHHHPEPDHEPPARERPVRPMRR